MTGGDLFVPFLDRSLESLREDGRCAFLCSDRWRFMAFGEGFRRKWLSRLRIDRETPVSAADVFVNRVGAYPSLFVAQVQSRAARFPTPAVIPPGQLLADAGYSVRVGPALGCSLAFVLEKGERDVESSLLRPWISASEVLEGTVSWHGRRVVAINGKDGRLVELSRYPKLAARLERHRTDLEQRSIVANGAKWYRAIDRVRADDWRRPKLLVPEMAQVPRVALDLTGGIPSHGVYAIFAKDDDVLPLLSKLSNGGLARALDGLAPRVGQGYVRCYRRFLNMIRI
jgi:hypothetical protein